MSYDNILYSLTEKNALIQNKNCNKILVYMNWEKWRNKEWLNGIFSWLIIEENFIQPFFMNGKLNEWGFLLFILSKGKQIKNFDVNY